MALLVLSLAVLGSGAAIPDPSTMKEIAPGVFLPILNLVRAGDSPQTHALATCRLTRHVAACKCSQGTCCGSDPKVGLMSWLAAGGVGIDTGTHRGARAPSAAADFRTIAEARAHVSVLPILSAIANDYNDQSVIASILNPYIEKQGLKRSDFFITTKVPAGFGGAAACKAVSYQVCRASCKPARRLTPHRVWRILQDPSVSLNTLKQNLQQLKTDYVDLVLLHKPCPTAAQNNALWCVAPAVSRNQDSTLC